MSLLLTTSRLTYLVQLSPAYRQFLRYGLDMSTYSPPPLVTPPPAPASLTAVKNRFKSGKQVRNFSSLSSLLFDSF
jgi:hypothetical protein